MNGGRLVWALILLAAGFALGQVVSLDPEKAPPPMEGDGGLGVTPVSTTMAPAVAGSGLTPGEERNIEVFRRTAPSVVNITAKARVRDWRMNVRTVEQGSGSGFVWDRDGHVVTNHHVVREGTMFVVTLADQSEWEGKVVGIAPEKDLAVLRIDAPRDHLVPLEVGTSGDLLVGQGVLAVGNPFGLDHSLSTGVVSALGRELEVAGSSRTIRGVIQTDAAINPGNSGGPLLDSAGRVIGVNTAIYSPSGASAGIGFAIPADTVRRLVPQLIDQGSPVQAGIKMNVLDDYVASRLGFEGVVVYEVVPGGPADRAGLLDLEERRRVFGRRPELVADEIVAVDDEPVSNLDEMLYRFEQAGVGGEVVLTVRRDGKMRNVRVELARVR